MLSYDTEYMREAQRICLESKASLLDSNTEVHHWQPRSLGGTDDKQNLIRITTEEHFKVHLLLYYHFKKMKNEKVAGKMASACWMMSGARRGQNRVYCTPEEYKELRETHIKNMKTVMSETMKGKIPVYDISNPGVTFHASVDDPNVKSGQWVHHSKGKATYIDTRTNEQVWISVKDRKSYHKSPRSQSGKNNGRWYDITDEEIMNLYKEFSIKEKMIVNFLTFVEIHNKTNKRKIPGMKGCKGRCNGKTNTDLFNDMKKMLPELPSFANPGYSKQVKKEYFGGCSSPIKYLREKYATDQKTQK